MALFWSLVAWLTRSRIGRWLGAAVVGAALGFTMLWKLRRSIRRDVETEIEVDRLKGAIEADERMDHADIGHGASDDDNREWLRSRAAQRRKPRP